MAVRKRGVAFLLCFRKTGVPRKEDGGGVGGGEGGGSFRKREGGSKPGGNYDLLFLNCERHDSELFSMSNLTKYFSEKSFYIEQSHFKENVKNNRSITEAYARACEKPTMEFFAKIIND